MIMCRVLKVSRSGYYAWQRRPTSTREQENITLEKEIELCFEKHKKRYGSPRICRELRNQGRRCGRHRIARLMRKNRLVAHGKRKFRATTNSKHKHPVHPNLLSRMFTATGPNQVWTGDITYIRTLMGWLYLAVVIDLYSRKVVGWAMGSRINSMLVVKALRMAIAIRKPGPGIIFHSDRGTQYAGHLFQRVIKAFKFRPSMSRKGDCWDNAPIESFFATLKKELIRNLVYITRRAAVVDIFRYIEGYYNPVRLHSTLDYQSPVQFEKKVA
jgi:transposase InsO family protein